MYLASYREVGPQAAQPLLDALLQGPPPVGGVVGPHPAVQTLPDHRGHVGSTRKSYIERQIFLTVQKRPFSSENFQMVFAVRFSHSFLQQNAAVYSK